MVRKKLSSPSTIGHEEELEKLKTRLKDVQLDMVEATVAAAEDTAEAGTSFV